MSENSDHRQTGRIVEGLNRLKETLLVHAGLPEKLKKVTDGVVEIFGADFARIWIINPGDRCDSGCFHATVNSGPHVCHHREQCLFLMASSGRYTHIDGEVHRRVPFGCYKIGRIAAAEDTKFLTNDVVNDPRVHNHEWAAELGLVSFVGYRLLSTEEKPIGVLALFNKKPISPEEDGLLEGLAGSTAHVIQTAQAEEELRRLRNLLSNIVNSMPSILIGVDTEGLVTQWNREAELSTGVTAENAHGHRLERVFPQLAGEMEKVKEALRSRESQEETKVPNVVDGETRFSNITVFPLESNGIDGAVIRVDDVTERIRIEEMMIQSEKMLSVGGLAAGMAHEINNPLAGILQNIQVLQNRLTEDLPPNVRTAKECGTTLEAVRAYSEKRKILEMIESVKELGHRASQIVDNMLSFSRQGDPYYSLHDLSELIDKTLVLASSDYDLKRAYDFRRIEIVREYDPDTPRVPCESSKIQQVILNLLKNGAQAMAENGKEKPPRFILRVAPEGEMVRMEVEDNGCGMEPAVMKRVFEPFFTTKEAGIGTGLGLSISYFIITENHGGTMSVESLPGRGSTFIIKLSQGRDG
jgi:PAS domain S-box-containing protein